VPPLGAAAESVTVHVVPAPGVKFVGEHCSAETPSSVLTLPPVPETATFVPSPKVPSRLVIETGPPVLPEATVAVTTATTPLLMPVEFMPLATQVIEVGAELQLSVLPTAFSAGPVAALRALMPVGYESVHCRPAGALLPAFRDRFRETEPPGAADPEAKLKDCA
jgi:hypothetical protein